MFTSTFSSSSSAQTGALLPLTKLASWIQRLAASDSAPQSEKLANSQTLTHLYAAWPERRCGRLAVQQDSEHPAFTGRGLTQVFLASSLAFNGGTEFTSCSRWAPGALSWDISSSLLCGNWTSSSLGPSASESSSSCSLLGSTPISSPSDCSSSCNRPAEDSFSMQSPVRPP